jgi:hypothetical protein
VIGNKGLRGFVLALVDEDDGPDNQFAQHGDDGELVDGRIKQQ